MTPARGGCRRRRRGPGRALAAAVLVLAAGSADFDASLARHLESRALASGVGQGAAGERETGLALVAQFARSEGATYSDVWGYDAPDGTALAIVGFLDGTWFVDVTNPSRPREVASISGPHSPWRDIKTGREHAFIVEDVYSETSALQVVDLTEPRAPRLVLSTSEFFQRCHNIYLEGDLLYCVGTRRTRGAPDEMVVLDISTPQAPVERARFGQYAFHDIYVRGSLAYGAAFSDGSLVVLDMSDPSRPTPISRTPDPQAATHNTWLSRDGRFCFVSSERESGYLDVFDVSDPHAPFHVADWKLLEYPAASIHNVHVEGDLAFCSWYTAGLQVLDVSQPHRPQRVAFYDTHPQDVIFDFAGDWGVYPHTRSGLIYASDMQSGLFIFRYVPRHGRIDLAVRNADTGEPVAAALVRSDDEEAAIELETGAEGGASFLLLAGERRLRVERFGFAPAEVEFEVAVGETTAVIAELSPLASGVVAGTVRVDDGRGDPLAGARVRVLESPLEARTGTDGTFRIAGVPAGSWRIRIDRFGYRPWEGPVEIGAGGTAEASRLLLPALHVEDFEQERGWAVGRPEDTAVQGAWERADPVGSGVGNSVQPEDDHSEDGTHAFVTGNGEPGAPSGETDLDGGTTTLTSPRYDLSGLVSPILVYHRWFTTSDDSPLSGDELLVLASGDDGATWVEIARHTANAPHWTREEIALGFYVKPTAEVRLRFVARDGGTATLVEAGLDDLQIHEGEITGPVPAPLDEGERFRLLVTPHPLRGAGELRLQMAEAGDVALTIHDLQGRRLATVFTGPLEAGPHAIRFDGQDDLGGGLPRGVYLLAIRIGSAHEGRRIVWIP